MRQLSARDQMTQKLITIGHHIASISTYDQIRFCEFYEIMVNKKKYFCEKNTGMIFIIRNRIRLENEVLICLGPETSPALPNCLSIMSTKYVSYGAKLSIKL